ncbi:hypothetical protein NQ314_016722 [Rhamnusium bicolor]|uniref:Gustatory receptor n=1 Tax=Rhamnusium bicolor TaxID=1586634 RepID=A0AAV8WW59_9CUCU|nr:hypothetical protein NQ314_016722 [Rhamnusium bicolor]
MRADYGLSVMNRYTNMYLRYGDEYVPEKYYYEMFPQFFRLIRLNVFTAIICSCIQVQSTLLWAFNDLFIILMSIALALRFRQISERLNKYQNKFQIMGYHFWLEIREDYDRLSILCKELDKHISYIVLLSFSLNMFFLLVQLYHSLETVTGVVGKIYFVFSFVYLIIKVVSVSIYAAWINDESIRRLLQQISFDNVALTGCRMFKVTRGIILSVSFYVKL